MKVKRAAALLGIISPLLISQAEARPVKEYFVSPSGSERNNGSQASPWPSVEYALSKISGGNIITLMPGVYRDPIVVDVQSATGYPTVIQSQNRWEAVIQGVSSHGVYTADGITNVVIDGLQVANAALDGIKVGSFVTVKNCWIHHASGQGVAAHSTRQTLIERNLIEYNGTSPTLDHGIYISGTNNIVRCNVIRWNKTYGCQIYYDPPSSSAECKFYNNLVYGNKDALSVWSPTGQTNYVFNNTLVSTNYVLIADYGKLCVTNNILVGAKFGQVICPEDGANVWTDYNLTTVSSNPHGLHDVVTASPGFVNAKSGQFWLKSDSAARGMAAKSIVPRVNFFGQEQAVISDISAFQYNPQFTNDTRTLDPASAMSDYWLPVLASP